MSNNIPQNNHNNNNNSRISTRNTNNRRRRTCHSSVGGDSTTTSHHRQSQTTSSENFDNNDNRFFGGQNRRSSTGRNPAAAADERSSNNLINQNLEIDGFYFDPRRRRYFRVAGQNQSSPSARQYTAGALNLRRREDERLAIFQEKRPAPPKSISQAPLLPLKRRQRFLGADPTCLLARRQFDSDAERTTRRLLDEMRASSTPKKPTTVRRALDDRTDVRLDRCQYIGPSPDGDNILGCWSVSQSPWGTRIMCLNVRADGRKADERTYGLEIRPTDNFIYTLDRNVVDICPAKMDSAVTCVLYVTLPAAASGSHIFLQPVPEMSNICDQEFLGSPIYNAHWEVPDTAWSCAFEPRHMRVSLGMEKCGIVVDMVSEKDFRLNSRYTNVLTQRFSKDGNLLFMGLRNNEILCSDLRLYHHRTVFTINQFSTCFLGIMRDENYLMSANFHGQVKLWDLRQKRVVQEFSGLKNTYTKTPVVFNDEETVAFAVGEDGTTQGWSLKSGQILCKIPAPRPVTNKDEIPKLCYSNRWGGRYGNAALCSAVGDSIHFYEMTL